MWVKVSDASAEVSVMSYSGQGKVVYSGLAYHFSRDCYFIQIHCIYSADLHYVTVQPICFGWNSKLWNDKIHVLYHIMNLILYHFNV